MKTSGSDKQSMHWLKKMSYLLAVVVCLILGVVGLILPIIPGLIFLFLAVLLLSKVSGRVNSLATAHAGFRKTRNYWHRMSALPTGDRLRLGMWYCAGLIIGSVERGVSYLQSKLPSGSPGR